MAEDSPGFFGRWSRRKTEVLQGKPLQESIEAPVEAPVHAPLPSTKFVPPLVNPSAPPADMPHALASHPATSSESPAASPEKTLSLDDVRQLTQDSDFKPFAARGVAPEVRNAAMKKLFADPHYNVMDGLDIYIDDYSRPDPIPASMLRQMTGARLLKIFDDLDEVNEANELDGANDADSEKALPQPGSAQASSEAVPAPAASPNNHTPQTVAQSAESSAPTRPDTRNPETISQPELFEGPGASQHDHADPHLRLQPDHAPPAADVGRGTS